MRGRPGRCRRWRIRRGGWPSTTDINTQNAGAYANALRQYVSANARNLILNYKTWDAAKAHWYNEPWWRQREAISGTYAAGEFGPGIFPNTGLRTQFNTNVLTYYDERAAYT